MKKTLKTVLSASGLALMLALTSCVKINAKLAEKINVAAETSKESDDYTFAQLQKKLGDPSSLLVNGSGIASWSEKKGNTTYTLTVTFASNKATKAVYSESTEEEKSK